MSRFKVRKRLKVFLPSFLALAILVIAILGNNSLINELSSYSPLSRNISRDIDLEQKEIRNLFDSDQDEIEAEKYAKYADKLDGLVLAGKISENQKDNLLDNYDPLWT